MTTKIEGPARVAMAETRAAARNVNGADAQAAFWQGVDCGRKEAALRPDTLVVVLDAGVTEEDRKAVMAAVGRLRGVAGVTTALTMAIDRESRAWTLAAAWARLAQARGAFMPVFDGDDPKTAKAREWLEILGVDVDADPPVVIPE